MRTRFSNLVATLARGTPFAHLRGKLKSPVYGVSKGDDNEENQRMARK
jgi:hypothetical protein